MTYEQSITVLDEKQVIAECGPMRLVIQAWKNGHPQAESARQAAEMSFSFLERVARFRKELSLPVNSSREKTEDEIVCIMIQSVKLVGDEDLTPMAAVAGTIADLTADWLFSRGMDKVVIDNGGDIAVRLSKGQTVSVGIRPNVRQQEISHILRLDHGSWGITTSGFGGRSFTRGIASAVTTVASRACVADAAATAIANACYADDCQIVQIPAEQLDPGTDLTGIPVTVQVGLLSEEKILQALGSALKKSENLSGKGVITGAFIAVGNVFAMTENMRQFCTLNPKGFQNP